MRLLNFEVLLPCVYVVHLKILHDLFAQFLVAVIKLREIDILDRWLKIRLNIKIKKKSYEKSVKCYANKHEIKVRKRSFNSATKINFTIKFLFVKFLNIFCFY
jgi:hypothetical protein